MLASHFGVEWDIAKFGATREGRPYLEEPKLASTVDFNISHDCDWVVMAFRRSEPVASAARQPDPALQKLDGDTSTAQSPSVAAIRVGVDVMSLALPKHETSVRSFAETLDTALTRDETSWVLAPLSATASSSSPAQQPHETTALNRLYQIWTYKEAFTKNIGKGLGFGFTSVEFDFGAATMRIRGETETRYVFTDVLLPRNTRRTTTPPSQLVVCEGPLGASEARSRAPFAAQISATDAQKRGLLTIWTMQELVSSAACLAASDNL
jgi:phosphopantetheinyl transferase